MTESGLFQALSGASRLFQNNEQEKKENDVDVRSTEPSNEDWIVEDSIVLVPPTDIKNDEGSVPRVEFSGLHVKSEVLVEDRITLSWRNINVDIIATDGRCRKKKTERHLLRDVDGIVKPGSLMAVMGGSGAGKTTLLNCLAFRKSFSDNLQVTGKVLMNSIEVGQDEVTSASVFIQQEDIFIGYLTVREHLNFHATLRMRECTKQQRNDRIERIMDDMGLKKCENACIGIPEKLKGISGGEQKRLAIATEILHNPVVIFADEPTTGLDSYMAKGLITMLKKYADHGRTIICTIHQPSSEIFELFDHICLMANGKCVFIGNKEACLSVFDGADIPCPKRCNPYDHFIFTLAVKPGHEERSTKRAQKIEDVFHRSDEYKDMLEDLDGKPFDPLSFKSLMKLVEPKRLKKKQICGKPFVEFGMLMKREAIATFRDPKALWLRLFFNAFVSFAVGATWFHLDYKDEATVKDAAGVIFAFNTFMIFSSTLTLSMVMANHMSVVIRDYQSQVYSAAMYYIVTALFYSIDVVIQLTVNFNIFYWMTFNDTAINEQYVYPRYYLVTVLNCMVGIAIGMMCAVLASNASQASTFTNINVFFMLYGGYLIPHEQIKYIFQVFMYLSPWFYSQDLIMAYLYLDFKQQCTLEDAHLPNQTIYAQIEAIMIQDENKYDQNKMYNLMTGYCRPNDEAKCTNFQNGEEILKYYEIDSNWALDYGMLYGLIIIFHTIALSTFLIKMYIKKKKS